MAYGERGLGRGLGALIPTGDRVAGGYREIAVSSIVPNTNQPRAHFDEEPLDALADSIGRIGVLQPILVRQVETDRFELIAGERRWRAINSKRSVSTCLTRRAAKRAGLQTIPALVRSAEDQESLEEALVENLHREDLNPLEEAAAFLQLQQDFGLTQQAVANRVGRSRAAVTNSTRLLQLPGEVQELIASRRLSAGHGRALVGIADSGAQVGLARQIEDHLRPPPGTGQVAAAGPAKQAPESGEQGDASAVSESALLELENLLAEFLSTTVRVEIGDKKGRLTVEFAGLDDLERIYHLVTR